MKRTHLFRTLLLAGGAALALCGNARADFAPIPLNPASFNNDPVVEVGAPAPINAFVTATMDGGTNKNGAAFYERGYNAAAPTTGMPLAGSLVSDGTLTRTFQMPPSYQANNAVMVGKNAGGATPLLAGGTLTLTTPGAYSLLSFLATSGGGQTLVGYRIRFADTSTEEGTFTTPDWFPTAVYGVFTNYGRVSLDGGVQNVNGTNAAVVFAVDVAVNNSSGTITGIDLFYAGSGGNNNTNNNGRAAIFAVSGSTDFVNFSPITVTGFTYDVVVEANAPATAGAGRNTGVDGAFALTNHITLTMDGGTNLTGSTWYEKGYYSGLPTTGLPVAGGSVTSAWNSARYTMPSSYVGNCAVMLAQHLNSANISFATPAAYGAISLLAGVANGDTTLPVVINFQDGSSETNVVFVPDWHNRATPWAYLSMGRVQPNGRNINEDAGRRTNPFALGYPFAFDWRDITGGLYVPRLHDCVINITNTASAITNISLSFTNGANSRVVSIFAVSGAPVGAVPPVFGVNGSPRPGQPLNAVANNITRLKRWEGTNNIVLSVTNIAGTGVTYQWKKAPQGGGFRDLLFSFDYSTFANVVDGGRISGATTSALVISNALSADTGDYLVVASSAGGSVTSHVATVTVLTTNQSILVGTALGDTISNFANDTTPAAEGIAQAIDRISQKWLSRGNLNDVLPFLGPVGYTVTPVSGASIVTSMRFFCANDDDNRDPMDYSLEGSNDGSTWSQITGGRLIGTLALPTARNNVVGSTPLDALNQNVVQVSFPNAAGYNSYRVLITNNVQNRLTTLMQISEIELLGSLVPNPPVWARQPDSAVTVFVGASPSFTVSASGNPAPRYQWYRNSTTAIAGATNATYTFPNAQLADSGTTFHCVASNSFGQLPSSSVTLTVIPAPAQAYPSAVLANNPIGYWRLNENPDNGSGNNGVVARDYRGGHNGYYSNALIALPGYNPTADPDTASQFGAPFTANSYIANINDVSFARPANSPGATFSVEAWVYGGNQSVDAAIVTKGWNGALNAGTGTGTEQFVLDVIGTPVKTFRFLVRDAAGNGRVALSTKGSFDPVTLQPVWRHLVGVCDQPNGKVYLYVDGLLAATGDIPSTNGILNQPFPMTIGARKSGGTAEYDNQWSGVIDDVAIYNSALTPGQILAHYYAAEQPPQIALQPTNTTTADSVPVTFYSSAYGSGTVGYQWYLSDGTSPLTLLSGQTSSNLTFTTSGAQNGNFYQLVVTNNYGSVTSAVAQLTVVSGPPQILVDIPSSQFIYAGRTIVLAVQVGGTAPFTFQWQKNGANLSNGGRISGATSNVLTITYAGTSDNGNYQLLVSNGQGGPVPSTMDAITVQAVPQLNAAGAGWTLQGSTAPTMDSGSVVLTSGAGNTARSVFYNAPLYVGAFEASFVYHDVGGGGADGATFTIQNDPRGATALGGGGGALAYSGITPSVGLGINIYEPNTRGIALLQNGTLPAAGAWTVPTPVVVGSVNPMFVRLRYSAGSLRVTLVESNTANVYNNTLAVNIPSVVGGDTAYVGFTAADGGVASTQVISNFTFVPITGLAVQPSGNNVLLSWPASIGGYALQSNTNVANAASWENSAATVNQVGNQNQATVPAAGNQGYYRLRLVP